MMIVKTKVAPSKIDGVGLFSEQFIAKGEVVWMFHQGFDAEVKDTVLESLPEVVKEVVYKYSYVSTNTGKRVLEVDNGRFVNHSLKPNIGESKKESHHGEFVFVATQDIQPGDEITANYKDFDVDLKDVEALYEDETRVGA